MAATASRASVSRNGVNDLAFIGGSISGVDVVVEKNMVCG